VQDYAHTNQVESIAYSFLRMVLPAGWLGPANLAALLIFLGATTWIFQRWWLGSLSGLHVLAWVGLVTNLFDPRAISYEQITLVVPFFIWTASRRGNALAWLAALVITWGLFSAAASGMYPLATEQGPILFYSVWLVWLFRQANSQRLIFTEVRNSPV
jgi:hypothetical protein